MVPILNEYRIAILNEVRFLPATAARPIDDLDSETLLRVHLEEVQLLHSHFIRETVHVVLMWRVARPVPPGR